MHRSYVTQAVAFVMMVIAMGMQIADGRVLEAIIFGTVWFALFGLFLWRVRARLVREAAAAN